MGILARSEAAEGPGTLDPQLHDRDHRSGPDVDFVHDRMPVVVEPQDLEEWIDPAPLDGASLGSILRPSPAGTLVDHEVSTNVNSVDNEGPELIEAVTRNSSGTVEEPTLF